jgi:hypothetical protein
MNESMKGFKNFQTNPFGDIKLNESEYNHADLETPYISYISSHGKNKRSADKKHVPTVTPNKIYVLEEVKTDDITPD